MHKEGHRPLVLVVEDNETDAYIVNKAIKHSSAQAQVVFAGTLATAQACLQPAGSSRMPDVVLVDLQLPDGDGLELVEWARTQPHLTGVRFVVVSTHADDVTVGRAYRAGVHSFVSKGAILADGGFAAAAAHYWLAINEPLPA